MRRRRIAVSLAWLAACGVLLTVGILLMRQGLDRADKWSSMLGLFVNVAALAVAILESGRIRWPGPSRLEKQVNPVRSVPAGSGSISRADPVHSVKSDSAADGTPENAETARSTGGSGITINVANPCAPAGARSAARTPADHRADSEHYKAWLRTLRQVSHITLRFILSPMGAAARRLLADLVRSSRGLSQVGVSSEQGRAPVKRERSREAETPGESVRPAPWEARELGGMFLWLLLGLCIVISQCQAPSTPPSGSVILSDNFADSGAWSVTEIGSGKVAPLATDERLSLSSAKQMLMVASSSSLAAVDTADSSIEIDIVSANGEGSYGILCNQYTRDGGYNFYQFSIRDDGYVGIFKMQDGSYGYPLSSWQPAVSFRQYGGNHLLAVCQRVSNGVRLELWVNGSRTVYANDNLTPLLRGGAGVFAQANNNQSLAVVYDDLLIKSLAAER